MVNRKFMTENARITDAYLQVRSKEINESNGNLLKSLRGSLPIDGEGSSKTGSKLGVRKVLPFDKRDARNCCGHRAPMKKTFGNGRVMAGPTDTRNIEHFEPSKTGSKLGVRKVLPFDKRDEHPTSIGRISNVKDVSAVKRIRESIDDIEDFDGVDYTSETDNSVELTNLLETVLTVFEQIYDNLSEDDQETVDEISGEIENTLYPDDSDEDIDEEDFDIGESYIVEAGARKPVRKTPKKRTVKPKVRATPTPKFVENLSPAEQSLLAKARGKKVSDLNPKEPVTKKVLEEIKKASTPTDPVPPAGGGTGGLTVGELAPKWQRALAKARGLKKVSDLNLSEPVTGKLLEEIQAQLTKIPQRRGGGEPSSGGEPGSSGGGGEPPTGDPPSPRRTKTKNKGSEPEPSSSGGDKGPEPELPEKLSPESAESTGNRFKAELNELTEKIQRENPRITKATARAQAKKQLREKYGSWIENHEVELKRTGWGVALLGLLGIGIGGSAMLTGGDDNGKTNSATPNKYEDGEDGTPTEEDEKHGKALSDSHKGEHGNDKPSKQIKWGNGGPNPFENPAEYMKWHAANKATERMLREYLKGSDEADAKYSSGSDSKSGSGSGDMWEGPGRFIGSLGNGIGQGFRGLVGGLTGTAEDVLGMPKRVYDKYAGEQSNGSKEFTASPRDYDGKQIIKSTKESPKEFGGSPAAEARRQMAGEYEVPERDAQGIPLGTNARVYDDGKGGITVKGSGWKNPEQTITSSPPRHIGDGVDAGNGIPNIPTKQTITSSQPRHIGDGVDVDDDEGISQPPSEGWGKGAD